MHININPENELQQPNNQESVATEANVPSMNAVFAPEANIIETADHYEVTVDMPGVQEATIDALVDNDILTIRGHAPAVQPPKSRLAHQEYEFGDYRRVFTLSKEVNREQISATVKDGVLSLILPKSEESKARRIPIKTV